MLATGPPELIMHVRRRRYNIDSKVAVLVKTPATGCDRRRINDAHGSIISFAKNAWQRYSSWLHLTGWS
jgi:hypothetical protein